MEHLWAPWRMAYVVAAKCEGCVFCDMTHNADNDGLNHVLYRGRYNFVVLNAYPYNSGHVMIVPYVHVGALSDLEDDALCDMMRLARVSVLALERCTRPDGINLGMNIGRAAGAGIDDHVHMHVVPRWSGDTNYMTAVGDVRVAPQSLDDCAATVGPVLHELAETYEKTGT